MAALTQLNANLIAFITSQPLFFVATAAPDGRVNVSPKGLDSLRVLDERRICWLSLSGSGNETAAHVRECPRMTLMFCAFGGEARIVRVYGQARVIHPADDGWAASIAQFPPMAGSRQVFELDIDLVTLSCGTGVPLMRLEKQRGPDELLPFYAEMGPTGVEAFWQRKNRLSIDGKPTGL
jgi:Pyridoxamine 5'-phosphate oxidase